MIDNWRKEEYPDLISFAMGALLVVSPWAVGFMSETSASWNAVLSGSLITLLSLIGLAVFVDWQAWWNLAAGVWVAVSPWLIAFSTDTSATRVHCIVGTVVAVASVLRISLENDPPVAV